MSSNVAPLDDEDIEELIVLILEKHPEGLTEKEIIREIAKEFGVIIPYKEVKHD